MSGDITPRQFLLTKYQADRALELELDKAGARFEIAFFQAVVVLNGAAATIFVSFLGANFEKLPAKALSGGFASFVVWVLGLVFGLVGGGLAYFGQGEYARRFGNRCLTIGLELLGRPENYKMLLGIMTDQTQQFFDQRSWLHQKRANFLWWLATGFGLISILLFVSGVVLASHAITQAIANKVPLSGI